jgi:hypothetical protein
VPNVYERLGIKPPEPSSTTQGPNWPRVSEPAFEQIYRAARAEIRANRRAARSSARPTAEPTAPPPQPALVPSYSPAFDVRGRFGTPPMMQSREVAEGVEAAERGALPFALRTAQGLAANPLISAPPAAAGEAAAQYVEGGEISSPGSVAAAAAIPPALATAGGAVRAMGRTATRLVPTLFQRSQGKALADAEEMVEGMRPKVNARQLWRSARAAGGDLIPSTNLQQTIAGIQIPRIRPTRNSVW